MDHFKEHQDVEDMRWPFVMICCYLKATGHNSQYLEIISIPSLPSLCNEIEIFNRNLWAFAPLRLEKRSICINQKVIENGWM